LDPVPVTITLATYNIHACIGTDGLFEPGRIVRVIKEIDPDVIALQEVEHHRIGGLDLLEYLAARTGLEAIAGPTLLRDTRHYGNALLTRLPVSSLNRVDLSVPGREPRGALDVTFENNGRSIRVVATHLGLKPRERRYQARRLLSLFEPGPAAVSVLMGDLNEWFLWGRIRRWLRAQFHATANHATFPSRWPLLAIDHIWVNPPGALLNLETHRTPLARIASDHLPLKASLTNELPDTNRRSRQRPQSPARGNNRMKILRCRYWGQAV
jgi:endonuclease/exonuclease/phosphatase family metal-dependent hydrolase